MALIGAIIGDIIGSQYEFPSMRPDDLDWKHCELFGKDCEFTDDTVMTLAVAKSLLDFNDNYNSLKETVIKNLKLLGFQYPKCGFGGMFHNWIFSENV